MQLPTLLFVFTGVCLGLQAYHYIVYPAVLVLAARLIGRAALAKPKDRREPSASLVICMHNEAGVIGEKVSNSLALRPKPLEIIVVDDGSTDGSVDVARTAAIGEPTVKILTLPTRGGKSSAINAGAKTAVGEVIVFSDASEFPEPDALEYLLAEFSDETVAVSSGTHRPGNETKDGQMAGRSQGIYWRYEDLIRRSESALGSTVGASGALLGVRACDWMPLPENTVNDDAYIAMRALASGRNVRFAHEAVCWEKGGTSERGEQVRRRRISAGRWTLLRRREIWPLQRPFVLLAFLSHKVLRLVLPLPMLMGLVANIWVVALSRDSLFFNLTLLAQIGFFSLAGFGYFAERAQIKFRFAALAHHIVRSNLTTLLALFDVLIGRSFVRWEKPAR